MKKRIRAEFRHPECKKKINENYKGRGGVKAAVTVANHSEIWHKFLFGVNVPLRSMAYWIRCSPEIMKTVYSQADYRTQSAKWPGPSLLVVTFLLVAGPLS